MILQVKGLPGYLTTEVALVMAPKLGYKVSYINLVCYNLKAILGKSIEWYITGLYNKSH